MGVKKMREGMIVKKFNVTGVCVKEKHYMVDTGEKVEQIMKLIDEGHYFTINRARQYGKTTTLFLRKAWAALIHIVSKATNQRAGVLPY